MACFSLFPLSSSPPSPFSSFVLETRTGRDAETEGPKVFEGQNCESCLQHDACSVSSSMISIFEELSSLKSFGRLSISFIHRMVEINENNGLNDLTFEVGIGNLQLTPIIIGKQFSNVEVEVKARRVRDHFSSPADFIAGIETLIFRNPSRISSRILERK